MKLILLSDLHLGAAPFHGREPLKLLSAVLEDIKRLHSDADAILMLGDLSDTGQACDYEALANSLKGIGLPVHMTLGNHDERAGYHAVFGGSGYAADSPVIAGHSCHLLDTLDPGKVGGSLDGGRLEALEAALEATNAPGFLFLHHPPIRTFAPAYDHEGLAQREELAALIARHPGKLLGLFFGHCHLPLSGTVAGVPAFCVPSLLSQSYPVFGRAEYRSNPSLPPAYGVLCADAAGFAFHAVTFCDQI